MKKKLFNLLFIVLIVIFSACNSNQPNNDLAKIETTAIEVEQKKLNHNLTLLVTSDVHGGIEDNWTLAGLYEKRKQYEKQGDYTLLIDDGDFVQGSVLSSISKGSDLMDIANAAGYDIMTMGNHEFDYGMEQFFKNSSKLNNSYISCNFNKSGILMFKPYVIKEFDGVKFAFIGINTPETLVTSKPQSFKDENGNYIYGFFQDNTGEALYSKIQQTIDNAKSDGADYVIAVAHVGQKDSSGHYKYTDIISNTTGFDVFLDGHSHDTDQAYVKDKNGKNVFRMGVGTKLSCIGVVTFTPAGTIEHELLTYEEPVEGSKPKYDNIVSQIVNEKNKKIGDETSVVIATTSYPLYIYDPEVKDSAGKPIRIIRRRETNLGDLIADAYKYKMGADCAVANGGSIRSNVNEGSISILDINTVQPFNDTVCLLEVTGQQIIDALEWGCHLSPSECGGFLQVSGITFDVDESIPSPCKMDDNGICIDIVGERRVQNVKINDEDIDLEKKYKLSILSSIAFDHIDGYTAFDNSKVLDVGTKEGFLIVIDYLKEDLNGELPEKYSDPYGEGRINFLSN